MSFWLFIWLAAWAVACGMIADRRGRNAIGWGVLGFLFSFLALIVLLCLRNLREEDAMEARLRESERQRAQAEHEKRLLEIERAKASQPKVAEKTCPQCAETVKFEAKICRFCNHQFVAQGAAD